VSDFLKSKIRSLIFSPNKYRDLPFKDQALLWQHEIPLRSYQLGENTNILGVIRTSKSGKI